MAYNAKVLSSQEKAMDEYLRRQRANAEQHIHQMYQSPYSAAEAARHRAVLGTKEAAASGGFVRLQEPTAKMPLTGVIPSSTPATPTGRRRNLPQSNQRNGSPSRYVPGTHYSEATLERWPWPSEPWRSNFLKIQ